MCRNSSFGEKWITGWYGSDKLINRITARLAPVFEKEEVFKVIAERLLARSEKIASMAGLIQEFNHQIKTPHFT